MTRWVERKTLKWLFCGNENMDYMEYRLYSHMEYGNGNTLGKSKIEL